VELADDVGVRAGQNALHFRFGAAITGHPDQPHHHAVAVHGVGGRISGNVKVAVDARDWPVGNHKAKPAAMQAEAAGNEFGVCPWDDVVAGANLGQAALLDKAL
jgi:hypothetical protein